MQKHNTTYQLVSIKRNTSHVTKIWQKAMIQIETSYPYLLDPTLERKQQELESLNEQIEAMTFNPIYPPPWGVGFTTQELIAVAKHEGANPYKYDW
jgi:hypothetical protein